MEQRSKNDIDFVRKMYSEGLGYSLTSYFSEKEIWKVEDIRLRDLALAGKKHL